MWELYLYKGPKETWALQNTVPEEIKLEDLYNQSDVIKNMKSKRFDEHIKRQVDERIVKLI